MYILCIMIVLSNNYFSIPDVSIEFINNTPQVTGNSMTANFQLSGCFQTTTCLYVQENTLLDCKLVAYIYSIIYIYPGVGNFTGIKFHPKNWVSKNFLDLFFTMKSS